jgi:hypothetical protein
MFSSFTPNNNERITVRIDEVDIPKRIVHGRDKHNSPINVSFRTSGAFTHVPTIGEFWTASRSGFEWKLESRVDTPEQHEALLELSQGDIRVDADGDIHLNPGPTGEVLVSGTPLGSVTAEDVSIADVANDFTATNVEDALAELQSDHETDASALSSHASNTSNPHSVTKTQVGLGNVTNDAQLKAADLDTDGTLAANSASKVPSQSAVKTYADTKASASHTHAQSDVTNLTTDLAAKAPIANPTFTGTAFAPTVAIGAGTNIATIGAVSTALASYLTSAAAAAAYLALTGGTLTGNLTTRTINFDTRAGLNADNDVPKEAGVYIVADTFNDESPTLRIWVYFSIAVVGTFVSASVADTAGTALWSE